MTDFAARGLKLLIADADPVFRHFVAGIAKDRAWHVSEASDGGQMIKLLEEGLLPDAVVLDIVMPDMGGIEAIHRLSEREIPMSVLIVTDQPILYATIATQLGDRSDLNVVGSLAKPVSPDELQAYLEQFERRSSK